MNNQNVLAAAPDHIADTRKMVSRQQIREVFLRNGFTIKPGCDDLRDYVYKAAFELLELAAPAVQGDPVAWSLRFRHGDKHERVGPVNYMTTFGSEEDADIYANRVARDIYGNPEQERRPVVVPLYAAPQPEELPTNLKDIVTSFYYWWHNQPGSNTADGYDEWISNPSIQRMIATRQPAEQQPVSHDWDDQDKCRRCGDRDWYASATCTPKWQPIETAPDREYIWILVDGQITGVGSTYLGDWWASMPNGEVCELNEPPTHWMPLPTPPETE